MQRRIALTVLVVVLLGSCSSSETAEETTSTTPTTSATTTTAAKTTTTAASVSQTFDLVNPMAPLPTDFAISGEAVSEGTVCPAGTFVAGRMEDMDGNALEDEDWAQMFENAVATGAVAEVKSFNEYECRDGSGMLLIEQHVHLDFAVLDIETFAQGRASHGTWTLTGTGDYESLTGSGEIIGDSMAGMIHMVGEVKA